MSRPTNIVTPVYNQERHEETADAQPVASATVHVPVLPLETLEWLAPRPSARYIDGTLGGAGHTALLLEQTAPDGRVLAIDADLLALTRARMRLPEAIATGRLVLRHGNFAQIASLAAEADFTGVDGVLLDLGLSSDQLADRARGFSFAGAAPLDMRFDPTRGASAADLVNTLEERELADLIYRYGDERRSRQIARRIVEVRARAPITRTSELASLLAAVVHGRPGGISPATRTFQALRIAVNEELASLEAALPATLDLLRPGGRLAVISFHSLEDRIVKDAFRDGARDGVYRVLTKKPAVAGEEEVDRNPRSRSAKLRAAERL